MHRCLGDGIGNGGVCVDDLTSTHTFRLFETHPKHNIITVKIDAHAVVVLVVRVALRSS